jgi:hypothetical protein
MIAFGPSRQDHIPYGLWSLWDMLVLDAEEFIVLLHTLLSTELMARDKTGPLSPEIRARLPEVAEDIRRRCEALELSVSARTADNMLGPADSSERMHEAIRQVTNSVMLELQGRKFYGPLSRFLPYYDQPRLFGDQVFNNLPSANDDLYEAGMCLALERPTACVMHLMRALEVGLAVLAKAVGVTRQNDWGAYLRGIEKELDNRAKTAGARSAAEQFYAEAGANFDRLRRAFRNPTMHPDKSYSQERAAEILLAMKSFMTHLVTRLSE